MNPTSSVAQAHADAGPTELAAQQRIAPVAGVLRGRVLKLVAAAGEAGLTSWEAYEKYVAAWGEPDGGLYSISPRLSELERRGGWVQKTNQRRARRAAYVATAAGRAWAEGEVAA